MFFASAVVAVSLLSFVAPLFSRMPVVSAQGAEPTQDAPIIRWYQGSSTADTVEFFGTTYFRGASGQSFATELLSAMGVASSSVNYQKPSDFFDGEDMQLVAFLDRHRLREETGWKAAFDVRQMAQAVRHHGFASFDIDVCPLISADVTYERDVDAAYEGCKSWTIDAADTMSTSAPIVVVEHPTSSFYRQLLAYIVGGSLVFSGLLVAATMWLRHASMRQLGGGNLAICVIAVFLAAGAATTTAGVLLFGVGSVDDVLIAHGWGWRQHAFLVLGPGLVTALPFLLSSIVIVRAKPREVSAPQASTIGGVPYWMVQDIAEQPATAPLPLRPTQQPSPPPSSPSPWDPPK